MWPRRWTGPRARSSRCTAAVAAIDDDRSVILIVNVGGPSQLDTWDPKPDAPAEVRGPFRAIRTSVPGIFISELFPQQARIAHRLAFVPACCHPAPAVHQVGWQLAQTGCDYPGSKLRTTCGQRGESIVWTTWRCRLTWRSPADRVTTPDTRSTHPKRGTHETLSTLLVEREPIRTRERYGTSRFGEDCLLARCLVEAGVRFVTLRTFADYRAPGSWDVHGGADFGSVESMRATVAPMYDQAYTALVEDLAQRGILDTTLVCSVAEFGRTPASEPGGGRDHWPLCWTTTLAGGGVRGGQVIGASDAVGGEPADRPVTPAEIVGTIYHSLGLYRRPHLGAVLPGRAVLITPAMRPIEELF